MGTNVHICIQIVPPKLTGGFTGANPPESTFAPPYGPMPSSVLLHLDNQTDIIFGFANDKREEVVNINLTYKRQEVCVRTL